jgi:hypothetical protein
VCLADEPVGSVSVLPVHGDAGWRVIRERRDQTTWHLPEAWPWQDAWHGAFHATHRAPPALAA